MSGPGRPAPSPSSWPTTTSSCARASGPCWRLRPTSRSSGRPPTTTSWWPGPPTPGPPGRGHRHPHAPDFQQEGIDAAHEIRKRHPGTGVVILSQFDDPEYAISLLDEGSAGYAYLLKDRVAEGDQLARAVRAVATGGSVLDPSIVEAHGPPGHRRRRAQPRPRRSCCASWPRDGPSRPSPPPRAHPGRRRRGGREAVPADRPAGEQRAASSSLRRLRMLHEAIVNREEQGESLEPAAPRRRRRPADAARGAEVGETEELVVSVLMSDIRGYSTIAEHADPSALARQLNVHRAEMNRAMLSAGRHGHAVRRRRRDGRVRGAGAHGGPRRPGRPGAPWPCTPPRPR